MSTDVDPELNDATGKIRLPTPEELAAELATAREHLAIARTATEKLPLDGSLGDRNRIEVRLDKVCEAASIDRETTKVLVLLVSRLKSVAWFSVGVSTVALVATIVRLVFVLSSRTATAL